VDANGVTVNDETARTHKMLRLTISNCVNQRINIQGFDFTATTGNCIHVYGCGSHIEIRRCSAVEGTKNTSSFYGLYVLDSSGYIYLVGFNVSNKNRVVRSSKGNVSFVTSSGVNNDILASAVYGGSIGVDAPTESNTRHDTFQYIAASGIVYKDSGLNASQINPTNSRQFVTSAEKVDMDALINYAKGQGWIS
jgi:hypothetical protein